MAEFNAIMEAILSFRVPAGLDATQEGDDEDERRHRLLRSIDTSMKPVNGSRMPLKQSVRATERKASHFTQKAQAFALNPSQPYQRPFGEVPEPQAVLSPQNASPMASAPIALFEAVSAMEAIAAGSALRIEPAPADLIEEDKHLKRGGGGSKQPLQVSSRQNSENLAACAALTAGASPAVFKVISSIHSSGAGTLLEYLGTREVKEKDAGKERADREDIPVYTQDGRTLSTKVERAVELAEFTKDFRDGYNITGAFTYEATLEAGYEPEQVKKALDGIFENKPYLYAVENGTLHVIGLSDADPRAANAELQSLKKKASDNAPIKTKTLDHERVRFLTGLAEAGLSGKVAITGAAVKDATTQYVIQKFIRGHDAITDNKGHSINKAMPPKATASTLQKAWSPHTRVRYPVNAYHMVFTAKAGTDPLAVVEATKAFLDEAVQDRKWIIAHHPETGHVHVHAMIAARSATGKPLRITKETLSQWRSIYAEKGREQGIAMVAISRRETASTRPYSNRQLATVRRAAQSPHPEKYPYAERLRTAIENKQSHQFASVLSSNGSAALKIWDTVAAQTKRQFPQVSEAARRFRTRLQTRKNTQTPLSPVQSLSHTYIRQAFMIIKDEIKTMAISPEQFEKREEALRKSVAEIEKILPAQSSEQVVAMKKSMEFLLNEVRPKEASKQQIKDQDAPKSDQAAKSRDQIKTEVAKLRSAVDPELDKAAAHRQSQKNAEALKAQKEQEAKAQIEKSREAAKARDRDQEQGR